MLDILGQNSGFINNSFEFKVEIDADLNSMYQLTNASKLFYIPECHLSQTLFS